MNRQTKNVFRVAALVTCSLALLGACAGRDVRPEVPPQVRIRPPLPVPQEDQPVQSPAPQVEADAPGGYYMDDGPSEEPPPNFEAIPDAEPQSEPLHPFANRPYEVLGRSYVPDESRKAYRQRGLASWYGRKFHGRKTSIGELYDMYAMTAAHRTLAIPAYVRVTHVESGKSVIVRVNDRGPFHSDRIIDLSYTAAHKLGIVNDGTSLVDVEVIDADLGSQLVARDEQRRVYLQLAAFSGRENADKFVAQLKSQLARTPHALAVFVKDGLYRAATGPYRTHQDATEAASAIRKLTKLKPLVIFR